MRLSPDYMKNSWLENRVVDLGHSLQKAKQINQCEDNIKSLKPIKEYSIASGIYDIVGVTNNGAVIDSCTFL